MNPPRRIDFFFQQVLNSKESRGMQIFVPFKFNPSRSDVALIFKKINKQTNNVNKSIVERKTAANTYKCLCYVSVTRPSGNLEKCVKLNMYEGVIICMV